MIKRFGSVIALAAGGVLLSSCADAFDPEISIQGVPSADGLTIEINGSVRDLDTDAPWSDPPPRRIVVQIFTSDVPSLIGRATVLTELELWLEGGDTATSFSYTADLARALPSHAYLCANALGVARLNAQEPSRPAMTCIQFTPLASTTTTTTTTSTSTTSTTTTSTSTTTPTIPVTPPTT